MSGFGYGCAVVLAAVFVWAAVAKAARVTETSAGFSALGVPAPAVSARAVPAIELVLAVALLAVPRVGGVAALVLLAAFSAFLAVAVRRGVRAGCRCFGATRVEPVSAADLVRNGLLAGLATAALAAPEPRPPGPVSAGAVVLAVVVGTLLIGAARRLTTSRRAGRRWRR